MKKNGSHTVWTKEKICTFLGIGLIVSGCIVNINLLAVFYDEAARASAFTKFLVWFVDSVLVITGVIVLKYKTKALVRILLLSFSILLAFALAEVICQVGGQRPFELLPDPHVCIILQGPNADVIRYSV